MEAWRKTDLSDVSAKMIIYEAFIESELEVPKHLARRVHDFYFDAKYDEFRPRTVWSLSNAFTSAFKELEPITNTPVQSDCQAWRIYRRIFGCALFTRILRHILALVGGDGFRDLFAGRSH